MAEPIAINYLLRNLVIACLIGGLFALGVRSMVTGDARFGWGTFCKQADWDVQYSWLIAPADGGPVVAVPHKHRGELVGEPARKLSSERHLSSRYSVGEMKFRTAGYCHYMYERRHDFMPDATVVGFQGEIDYYVNVNGRRFRGDRRGVKSLGKPRPLRIVYPPEASVEDHARVARAK